MSKMIRLTMMVALCLALAGQCLAAPRGGITSGFGSVTWGQDVGGREGFMKLRSVDGVDYYVNMRERFEMKGYGKPTVYYGQAGGRLYAVHLRLREGTGYDKLASELTGLYGKGKPSRSEGARTTRWKTGPVRVKLKQDQEGGMKLSFYYQPVAVTLAAAQREADPEELARMLPPDEAQVKVPAGAALPGRQEEQVGIDVLKYLKEGGQLLKLDVPRARGAQ